MASESLRRKGALERGDILPGDPPNLAYRSSLDCLTPSKSVESYGWSDFMLLGLNLLCDKFLLSAILEDRLELT